ncbi:BspC domain-containing protein [Paraburkholderia unamae]|jgi:hypothetical protein|uniref:Lipoprotein transmembrane n=1 Tax=Paraburkholderia unamae TaxID=219649 RepID=A0ABX5KD60_9BURK|nr:hypothetical protein [Paraburkholderia unamae]PVX74732.1 hypothetical protein C7402_119164 [Paraburkholderia unamae]CAG9272979.1 conserved exported hypothetical protein [Paraburkholderia unamae]
MDCNHASRRLLIVAGQLAACAASLMLIAAPAAQADQLDRHNDLVTQFVTQMHADPLVADCAAHGDFVANTSAALDHVEFPPSSFDTAHASVTPWNDSFDEGKQRVKVDTIVTVDGIGIPKESGNSPYDLKFRCGYVGQQMLAFSWNDPVPPARAHSERSTASTGTAHVKGKHSTKKATGKGSKKATSSKSSHKSSSSGAKPASKSTTKKTASKKKSTTAH